MSLVNGKSYKGTAGNDRLGGTSGDDTFDSGLSGTDRISSKAGDDEFNGISLNLGPFARKSNNGSYYDGGAGFDRAYQINIYTQSSKVEMTKVLALATFKNFEFLEFNLIWGEKPPAAVTISGTFGKDWITSHTYVGSMSVSLFDGDDNARIQSGNITIDAGAGKDHVLTGKGNDKIYGGDGDDLLESGSGDDKIYGGAGEDRISDAAGKDQIFAESGNDTVSITDDKKADVVDGGSGIDTLQVYDIAARIDLESGATSLFGDVITNIENVDFWGVSGNDRVFGSAIENVIKTAEGDDYVSARGGNDSVYTGDGDNRAYGGSGDDTLYGGENQNDEMSGNDVLDGGSGNDKLYGSSGKDVLYGGSGSDRLDGGEDIDTIRGGDGNDLIRGSWAADKLWGGVGQDTFTYNHGSEMGNYSWDEPSSEWSVDTIYDFSQKDGDKIDLSKVYTGSMEVDFDFIGSKTFSKHAGEVRYVKTASDTYIYVSQYNNGKASLAIHLDDAVVLTENDFIL